MKILIVAPTSVPELLGGTTRDDAVPRGLGGSPIVALVGALRSRGHHITVVTASPDLDSAWCAREQGLEVRVAPYRAPPRDRAMDLFRREIVGMAALMPAQHEVDVAHAHWTYEFALAALKVHPTAVITAHDSPFTILRHQPHPYRAARLLMAARVRSSARTVTAVSPYLAAKWRKQMRMRSAIEVIPNIGAALQFVPRRPAPIPTIVSVGDSSPWKNVGALIKAFGLIRRAVPDAELHLVGPGLDDRGALAMAEPTHSSIHFRGRMERGELGQLLSRSWLMVHPSLEESFGMSVAEAMAAGVPVVAGDKSGAVPWLLDHGRAGALVNAREPASIARQAIDLVSNEKRREGLAAVAASRIGAHFSPLVVADAYADLYRRTR